MTKNFDMNNIFAESMNYAFEPNRGLIGGDCPAVDEHEYTQAFAECMFAAGGHRFEIEGVIAESVRLGRTNGIIDAFFAESAVGGFFKSMLEKLIALWEKVKTFFRALAGRFKSADKYMKELPALKDLATKLMAATDYTDKVEVKIPKHDWNAIFGTSAEAKQLGIIRAVFSDKPVVFEHKYGTENVASIVSKGKGLVKAFEDGTDSSGSSGSNVTAIADALKKMQEKSNADDWALMLYKESIPAYKSEMKLENGKKVKDELQKVFSSEKKELKGEDISKDEYFQNLCNGIQLIDYMDLQKGIEKGVKFFTDKIDEMKSILKEVENAATKVRDNSSSTATDAIKNSASTASNLMTTYNATLTNFSTATVLMYNQSKVVLDRSLSAASETLNGVNKARKAAGIDFK